MTKQEQDYWDKIKDQGDEVLIRHLLTPDGRGAAVKAACLDALLTSAINEFAESLGEWTWRDHEVQKREENHHRRRAVSVWSNNCVRNTHRKCVWPNATTTGQGMR